MNSNCVRWRKKRKGDLERKKKRARPLTRRRQANMNVKWMSISINLLSLLPALCLAWPHLAFTKKKLFFSFASFLSIVYKYSNYLHLNSCTKIDSTKSLDLKFVAQLYRLSGALCWKSNPNKKCFFNNSKFESRGRSTTIYSNV